MSGISGFFRVFSGYENFRVFSGIFREFLRFFRFQSENPSERQISSESLVEGCAPQMVIKIRSLMSVPAAGREIDERQITHLICARLKYDLYDFFRGVLGLLCKKKNRKQAQKHPLESHIDHILGGHRLDEQSGTRLGKRGT